MVILAFAGMETTFAIWALHRLGWGPAAVGWTLCWVGILSAAMQGGAIGRLTPRFGEEALLRGGLALIALGLVALSLAHGIPTVLAASAFLAIGMGLTQPSINSIVSRSAGAEEQGQVLGVSQSTGSLARILGPAAAGVLFAHLGPDAPFYAGAVVVLLALVAALRLRPLSETAFAGQRP
jgi:MFS transporter, DHA1 family, tetracycline resistance protein